MAKTLKMNYNDAEIIKNNLYDAQDDLESKRRGLPRNVDGGDGTEYIVEMIAKTAEDAGDTAICFELGRDKTANVMDKIEGVDEGVAQMFRETEKKTLQVLVEILMLLSLGVNRLLTMPQPG